jgi:hypothetical protein
MGLIYTSLGVRIQRGGGTIPTLNPVVFIAITVISDVYRHAKTTKLLYVEASNRSIHAQPVYDALTSTSLSIIWYYITVASYLMPILFSYVDFNYHWPIVHSEVYASSIVVYIRLEIMVQMLYPPSRLQIVPPGHLWASKTALLAMRPAPGLLEPNHMKERIYKCIIQRQMYGISR